MAKLSEIVVPVHFEMTERSEAAIKALIAKCLRQALGDDESAVIPFVTLDALKDFVRVEVRKALKELLPQVDEHVREQIDHRVAWHQVDEPPHLLSMDLPASLPHFVRRQWDAPNGGMVMDVPLRDGGD